MRTRFYALSILAASVLAACGGGGGDSPATPVVSAGPDLQKTVPAPTYTAGSGELEAWNVLQQARDACGFGLLQQDARLDAAAKGHANYLLLNKEFSHSETAGKQGFTGATPADRAKAQGFSGSVSEGIAYQMTAKLSMIGLLTAPYHALDLVTPTWKAAGLGKVYSELEQPDTLVVQPGAINVPQKFGAGVVANYPCESAQNVSASWFAEVPNPFPDLTGYKGTSIILMSDAGTTLTITNLSIIRESTGEVLSYRTLTKENDKNGYLTSNQYVAVPIAALNVGENYKVSYNGTLDGKPVFKTFTFKPSIQGA